MSAIESVVQQSNQLQKNFQNQTAEMQTTKAQLESTTHGLNEIQSLLRAKDELLKENKAVVGEKDSLRLATK